MANEEQLRILKEEGVEAWNKWREDNSDIKIDFNKANLSNIDLEVANFEYANFEDANLELSNLYRANLYKANLRKANLEKTNFYRANLSNGDLESANLYKANLASAKFEKANFTNADLENVFLTESDLTEANFTGANLSKVQALYTNFSNAVFTGACIKDWNINSHTNLDNVICDYIYLEEFQLNRRPHDLNKNFKYRDFANLVQKALNTVDLIFSNGIDWQSFLKSFQNIQVEGANGQLTIQAIERKIGGAFLVRVEVPSNADKASIEASFWEKYNPLLEAKDREIKLLSQQTEFYSQQVEIIRKDNIKLLAIVETMAEKESSKVNMTFNAPVTGVAGNIQGNQNIFTSQSIAQASTEIQNLITTLQNNELTQEQAEEKVANNLATQAQENPTALGRLVKWGLSLDNKAAETSVSEVARRVIKSALNLAGVPMP